MLRLIALAFVAAEKAVATVEVEEGERVSLEVSVTPDEVLGTFAARIQVPEADAFAAEDAERLAQLRDEFKQTLSRSYETSQGRGQAQIELQNQMHPLERKERAARICDRVHEATKNAPPDTSAQLKRAHDTLTRYEDAAAAAASRDVARDKEIGELQAAGEQLSRKLYEVQGERDDLQARLRELVKAQAASSTAPSSAPATTATEG